MNRTTIICPRCFGGDSDLLELVREEETRHVIGHRLHCRRCENVWVDGGWGDRSSPQPRAATALR